MELRKPLICFGYEAKFDETHPFQASTQRRHNESLIFQLNIKNFFFQIWHELISTWASSTAKKEDEQEEAASRRLKSD